MKDSKSESHFLSGSVDLTDLVEVQNGKVTTTSLKIAEIFGKEHYRVLRTIENLGCSEDFNAANFGVVDYTDSKGEKRPCYNITRDGMSFLVMGFTGKEAALWKEKYIAAFNKMHKALASQTPSHEVTAKLMASMMKEIMPAMIESSLTDGHYGLVKDYSSVGQILDKAGVESKKRRSLIMRTHHSLKERCSQDDAVPKRCALSNKWLFPDEVSTAWLIGEGADIIANWRSEIAGQGVLQFVPKVETEPVN